MKPARARSLQWILVWRLILLQAAMLVFFIILLIVVLSVVKPRLMVDNEAAVTAIVGAIDRDKAGMLIVNDTSELAQFRAEHPRVWYVIHDATGQTARVGVAPPDYDRQLGGLLTAVDHASIGFAGKHDGQEMRPEALVQKVDTKVGTVQVVTSTFFSRADAEGFDISITAIVNLARKPDGTVDWARVFPGLLFFLGIVLLPIILAMGVTTLMTTPAVVRRSLAGLVGTADQAARIDFKTRAMQLPVRNVPQEIVPLVHAFNQALTRLAQGIDSHNRFLTDAAHELRTPIAILRTRAELLKEEPESLRLRQDIERLSHLAQQLLDHQSLERPTDHRELIDLVDLAGRVAADFAPLAIEAGYDLAFEPPQGRVDVEANELQIEQALANIIRNAIEHGGGRGTITVAVDRDGGLEVQDEGPGIPVEEHDNVFEPFYRLHPRSRGAGLGLNLARQIVQLHGGSIAILTGPWKGARVRIKLPLLHKAA
ncbi:HAMP domain-containing sensor histidine kinase [Rhizobium rhizogenes]|uniref:sensor histidine kinase n=1 Tax=Rhizobium rhizogenes TaxID=359 RepID=UPI001571B8B8|nr:HAMP domain-containing sensor histidine kinase [Rhizobium rhizogenes]NTF46310.1 HAMP domain-containing histidine kinase [Rhizobium rhizogenes]